MSNCKVIVQFQISISRLRDFVRSYSKTYYRILKQGSGFRSVQTSYLIQAKYALGVTWPPLLTKIDTCYIFVVSLNHVINNAWNNWCCVRNQTIRACLLFEDGDVHVMNWKYYHLHNNNAWSLPPILVLICLEQIAYLNKGKFWVTFWWHNFLTIINI